MILVMMLNKIIVAEEKLRCDNQRLSEVEHGALGAKMPIWRESFLDCIKISVQMLYL